MNLLQSLKYAIAGCAVGAAMLASSAFAGFSVSGTQLLDANGQPFYMRGINHPHAWYRNNTDAIGHIAATGSNVVRVVLADGQQWGRIPANEVQQIIELCKQHQLICMLEVHDATGSGESDDAGTIRQAAQYWVDIADVLHGEEDYVIINIANEPFGNNTTTETWVSEHRNAIEVVRNAGLTHTLVVDAANWGQDWEQLMMDNASEVANADTLNNTIFSIHMYEVYSSYDTVRNYISTFLSQHNLPLIVGEFGPVHSGQPVAAEAILELSQEFNIGYIGWSWSGNGSCCVDLDIVNNFNPNSLTSWGEMLIESPYGIRNTSVRASVFDGTPPPPPASSSSSSSASSTPSGGVCGIARETFPYCELGDQTDDTGDGWGWENEYSCVVPDGPADPNPGTCDLGGSSSSSSSAASSSVASSSSSTASSSSSTASSDAPPPGPPTSGGSLDRIALLLLLMALLRGVALRRRG